MTKDWLSWPRAATNASGSTTRGYCGETSRWISGPPAEADRHLARPGHRGGEQPLPAGRAADAGELARRCAGCRPRRAAGCDSTCSVSLFSFDHRDVLAVHREEDHGPEPAHSISDSFSPVAVRFRPASTPSPPPKPALLNCTCPS